MSSTTVVFLLPLRLRPGDSQQRVIGEIQDLAESIEADPTALYSIYFGVDEDDCILAQRSLRLALETSFKRACCLRWCNLPATKPFAACHAWALLLRNAYEDLQNTFFLLVGDDVRFV